MNNHHASSAKLDIWVESLTNPRNLCKTIGEANISKNLETKNEVLKSSGAIKLIYFDTWSADLTHRKHYQVKRKKANELSC
jgi:hypothetical protein